MARANDQTYTKHILQAIAEVKLFVRGMTFDQFTADLKTQLAIARELEIIGEAAKRFSQEFQDKNGHLPWRDITGMRDMLIHHYMEADIKEVWKAATEDLPVLKQALEDSSNLDSKF